MNESANSEGTLVESEKPVESVDSVKFPPFPDPRDEDFEDDISVEEKNYYRSKFADLNNIRNQKLHCTSCDRHLGCSPRNDTKMRVHPMLRTLICQSCHTFYNSGEFEKGDDGSELYCRWCGQGGQVYCCSDCPHVFCAKCIRRNMGAPKIKEIENADDWKCFKCNPVCLWDLRAICWALLRYCDLKNKLALTTEDPVLKEAYQDQCGQDDSTCCKHKSNRKKEKEIPKKKEESKKHATDVIISKIPSTIQVKKFASISQEELPKPQKKVQKRSASPKHKPVIIKNLHNALATQSSPKIHHPPLAKKFKLQPVMASYTRIRPKGPVMPLMPIPIISSPFNGFNNSNMFNHNMNNMGTSDNINLSLESLTQGLDMASMTAVSNNNDDDVVCTPDFPMEPLCDVTEDNDDDVQCMTPAPIAAPKASSIPPPLITRAGSIIPEISSENIIQMTENDVTVNAATGGLKFRVDPQTLSSNKMYRLPDGRIFAINANAQMPGGYSATIVALTESNNQAPARVATYAAKLSAVSSANSKSPSMSQESNRNVFKSKNISTMTNRRTSKSPRYSKPAESSRECDLNVPVEWYRYNLIDAVDALEYSLARLSKLKKEATSMFLRSRSVSEMRNLHRTLERLLNTSSSRFIEIKENLNKGLKQYISKKNATHIASDDDDDDDDDVEILTDLVGNDDPIFIDENSLESNANYNQEVDLTAASDQNESGENRDDISKIDDPHNFSEAHDIADIIHETIMSVDEETADVRDGVSNQTQLKEILNNTINEHENNKADDKIDKTDKKINKDIEKNRNGMDSKILDKTLEINEQVKNTTNNDVSSELEKTGDILERVVDKNKDAAKTDLIHDRVIDPADNQKQDTEKIQDGEMSEEMIETLLKDEGGGDNELCNLNCLEELQDT